MSKSPPFVDLASRTLDTDQILEEAIPLVGLVLLFAGIALVPFVLTFVAGDSVVAVFFSLLTQFVLAVGSGIVLLYIVARGVQLADA